jgi:hypothetical protein
MGPPRNAVWSVDLVPLSLHTKVPTCLLKSLLILGILLLESCFGNHLTLIALPPSLLGLSSGFYFGKLSAAQVTPIPWFSPGHAVGLLSIIFVCLSAQGRERDTENDSSRLGLIQPSKPNSPALPNLSRIISISSRLDRLHHRIALIV